MIQGFDFEHEGRKFTCTIEAPWTTSEDAWWWFRVSSDDRHRYAPFKATSADTRASVRSRIVQYYADLQERRAAPTPSYWRRGAPDKTAVTPAAVGAAPQQATARAAK
ncbi:hypothetical protein BH23GEM2_BH23GEM2_24210 [soil metagenome]